MRRSPSGPRRPQEPPPPPAARTWGQESVILQPEARRVRVLGPLTGGCHRRGGGKIHGGRIRGILQRELPVPAGNVGEIGPTSASRAVRVSVDGERQTTHRRPVVRGFRKSCVYLRGNWSNRCGGRRRRGPGGGSGARLFRIPDVPGSSACGSMPKEFSVSIAEPLRASRFRCQRSGSGEAGTGRRPGVKPSTSEVRPS